MATVEQQPASAAEGIPVENPATGEVIATVPVASADDVRAIVARARAAQPGWEALSFEGRAKILRRAQKWVVDNSDRIVQTIVSGSVLGIETVLIKDVQENSFGTSLKGSITNAGPCTSSSPHSAFGFLC